MFASSEDGSDSFDYAFQVPFTHRVRFTQDVLTEEIDVLLDCLEASHAPPKVLLIVEDHVADANAAALEVFVDRLDRAPALQLVGEPLRIAGGEPIKNTMDGVEFVLTAINGHDLDRRSYVVVVGGGAVLDMVGYAAAIAHRGVRLIRLPTTTLAQGDSGVGVKNAVNYFNKKNWVGTFAVPWAVINDASLLTTLPDRDFRCGFSECIKVSLLKEPNEFRFIRDHAAEIHRRDMTIACRVLKQSCLLHLRHITRGGDPFESLEARPLDFGHWSAHKMEPMSGYRLRHGEAVAIGLALDCIYSNLALGLPAADLEDICGSLRALGLPMWDETLEDADQVMRGLEEFRQHLGGRLTVTMLEGVGKPVDVHEIDYAVMKVAIDRVRRFAAERESVEV